MALPLLFSHMEGDSTVAIASAPLVVSTQLLHNLISVKRVFFLENKKKRKI
jgi:hypothetical protein